MLHFLDLFGRDVAKHFIQHLFVFSLHNRSFFHELPYNVRRQRIIHEAQFRMLPQHNTLVIPYKWLIEID